MYSLLHLSQRPLTKNSTAVMFLLKVIHLDSNKLTLQDTICCLDSTEETDDPPCVDE